MIAATWACAALAGGEAWDDGLTGRAPTSPAVVVGAGWVPGRDHAVFGDLQGGVPLVAGSGIPVAIGATASASTAHVWMGDGRSHQGLRNLAADVWVTLDRDDVDNLTTFSLRVGFSSPLSGTGTETSWFLLHPNEVSPRIWAAYDAYLDFDTFDFSFEARHGLGANIPLEAAFSGTGLVPVSDELTVGVGAVVGFLPFGTAKVLARYRPTPTVELGVDVGVPFPLFDPDGTVIAVQPGVLVKVTPGVPRGGPGAPPG